MDTDKCKYCKVKPASSGQHHDPSCPLYTRNIDITSKWSTYADMQMFIESGLGWSSPLSLINALIIPLILVPLIIFSNFPNYYFLIFLVSLLVFDSLFFIKRKHIKAIGKGIVLGLIFTLALTFGFFLASLL